jgi:hypothetical protein
MELIMNRKILFLIVGAVIAVAAGWNVSRSMNEEALLSDVALANVEALAEESSEEFTNATGCIACWENRNCKVGNVIYTYAYPKN